MLEGTRIRARHGNSITVSAGWSLATASRAFASLATCKTCQPERRPPSLGTYQVSMILAAALSAVYTAAPPLSETSPVESQMRQSNIIDTRGRALRPNPRFPDMHHLTCEGCLMHERHSPRLFFPLTPSPHFGFVAPDRISSTAPPAAMRPARTRRQGRQIDLVPVSPRRPAQRRRAASPD